MMRGATVPKASTNVNSAKLWLDLMLSQPGQIGLAKGGRTPFRPDVTPAQVDGAYTYKSVIDAIGEQNVIPVDYDPNMVKDHEAFMKRWMKAYNL